MDIKEYFKMLSDGFETAYATAATARSKGIDPEEYVEVTPAYDLAGKVEGIIGLAGLQDIIRANSNTKSRTETVFNVIKEICTKSQFDQYAPVKRIELAIRVGLAIMTDGVQVAPTEGINSVKLFRNPDNSDYLAIIYAGPIRGAGGTAAAMSVAMVDYAKKFFNIGDYKATSDEVERYVEEAEIYDARMARLQYKPSEDDIRYIVRNCPVCIDGVPTGQIEIGTHRNLKRINAEGKEEFITNKIRGGAPLVMCEGVAQKAKKLYKEVKVGGLDWNWLNGIIKIEKAADKKVEYDKNKSSFLDELVAGRPILAYPKSMGGFRLRYGRSRFTGIAAKGFSPATMIITNGFVAVGTQIKVELPGKGCIAAPVDSIEGPFVRLRNGEALRINDADTAQSLKSEIDEIISLGDILVTYGDFKKSNTPLQPSSYTEEVWEDEIFAISGMLPKNPENFKEAYELSIMHKVGIHPKYLFEFQAINPAELSSLASIALAATAGIRSVFDLQKLEIDSSSNPKIKSVLELINVPHKLKDQKIVIDKDYAQSLIFSLGLASEDGNIKNPNEMPVYEGDNALQILNSISPIKIPKRSTFIGARVGRPEKAKERLMKPAPNILFPVPVSGGKEHNLSKAYAIENKKLGNYSFNVQIARYVCSSCKRSLDSQYCYDCGKRADIQRICPKCGKITIDKTCSICKIDTIAYEDKNIDISNAISTSMKRLKIGIMPNMIKGLKYMPNSEKVAEPIDKGILRSLNKIFIFKDGTARFDATDMPVTHFYPKEAGVSIEKLKELGYDKDYQGNDIVSDEQLIEIKHQDIILNKKGAEYLLRVSKFNDEMLERLYGLEKFYNAKSINDMIGHLVITLSPHTSCGILGRIIGFTDANVGLCHPYTICARRRNCDGDEDTVMLLLDVLINFSKHYLPSSIGGTMDAPIILTLNLHPEEVDDEVHVMEVVERYGKEFYDLTNTYASPSEAKIELVEQRLGTETSFFNINFSHQSSMNAIKNSPKRSLYAELGTMHEKVDAEFSLMDKIYAVDKKDAAKKLILSHFIPDLIGNLNSFSKQIFRCSACNAKYRRIPLSGKCTKCGGKLLLTISKGGIEKYLTMSINIADRYELEPYIKQRLQIVKNDIETIFGETVEKENQFDLSRFI
jgi:DNA polymerase II large subunit